MANSIYCSPTHLKLIVGEADSKNVRVRDFAQIPLPEGGMINGIITDEKVMTGFMADANERYALSKEGTYLVIHSNSVQMKRMDVPPVAESRVMEFIKREFGQYNEEGADNVYDFAVLNPKAASGGVTILAVGAGRELLQTYKTVLVGAGFDLKGIGVGINCQIKLTHFLPQLRTGAYIMVYIDGRNLILTLFENGEYRISNSYRLINNPDTPEWFGEVGNNLSSMIQFSKGQRSNTDISSAYFAGVTGDQLSVLQANLAYLGIDISELNLRGNLNITGKAAERGDFNPGEYLFNIGNLLKQTR
jgi:Tfp pilus assembly PilM family ATPase